MQRRRRKIVAVYPYHDPGGRLRFEVVRTDPKGFYQRQPNGKGGFIYDLADVPPLIYRLTEVREAIEAGEIIYVVEGEKDAEALAALGLTATCSPGGAGGWKPEHACYLHGAHAVILADNDRPGRNHAHQVAASLQGRTMSVRLVDLPGLPDKGDVSDWLNAGGTLEKLHELVRDTPEWTPPETSVAPPLISRRACDITAESTEWLWRNRIPLGKLTMIGGHPGVGKSQVTTDMTATVTTGGTWPDGSLCSHPGHVAILSAEDDASDTIIPRLIAAGADLGRVHIIDATPDQHKGAQVERAVNLQTDLANLESTLRKQSFRAVIIDPLSAYLGSANSHKDAEIRSLLMPLTAVAANHRVAVVAITHFRKDSGDGDVKLRFMGSLAFVAAACAAWAVVADPGGDNEDADDALPRRRYLFLPAKNNLAPDLGGLAYVCEAVTIQGDSGQEIETSRVQWQDGAVHISADDALAGSKGDSGGHDALGSAKAFLREILADGPVPSAEIRKQAKAENLGQRTVEKAKADLGIVSRRHGKAWLWTFPEDS
jgi:archaellum biogenesis ATPase FlaH